MKKSQEPRSSSSCAACKFLKRKCTSNCQFAPYFRSDEPRKFAKVHKVFGASNVSKILNEVTEHQREDAVNSLVYEAEVRLRDPVYGCIGAIASLQNKMMELQNDLILARAHLAFYAHQQQEQEQVVPFSGVFMDDDDDDMAANCFAEGGNNNYGINMVDGNYTDVSCSLPYDHHDQLSQLFHYPQ